MAAFSSRPRGGLHGIHRRDAGWRSWQCPRAGRQGAEWAGKPGRGPGQGRPPGKVLKALGWQEQHRATGIREERTIESHRVHHAKIDCLELGSSGMKTTSSWPRPSLLYHDKACRDPSYSGSCLFSGLSNTNTGCHLPHQLIPLSWRAEQGPPPCLHLPRQRRTPQ